MHGEKDNRNNNGIDTGKTAVAIEYVPGEAAPKILATGKGAAVYAGGVKYVQIWILVHILA